MTKEEAIKYLQQLYPNGGHCWLDEQRIDVIDIAVKSLKEEPVWSEEDEEMFQSVMIDCSYCGNFPDYPTKEETELYEECLSKVEWLKSIKQRMKGE